MAIKIIGSGDDGESDSAILSEINITPLTDIFLVLLIIFMVTSSVMSQLGVDVDLPSGGKEVCQSPPEGVILTLLPSGDMKVNNDSVKTGDWALMKEKLSAAFKLTQSRMVILEGDRKAFLGSAIELMDQAKEAGAEKFAIATSGGSIENKGDGK